MIKHKTVEEFIARLLQENSSKDKELLDTLEQAISVGNIVVFPRSFYADKVRSLKSEVLKQVGKTPLPFNAALWLEYNDVKYTYGKLRLEEGDYSITTALLNSKDTVWSELIRDPNFIHGTSLFNPQTDGTFWQDWYFTNKVTSEGLEDIEINPFTAIPFLYAPWAKALRTKIETHEVPEKVLRKREKRGVKTTVKKFTVIGGFNPQQDSQNKYGTSSKKSAHWVRGHFKARKSGVYWWNPHIAGKGEVQPRVAYI